jgi:fibronectin type 3 domain-containing protein
VTGAGDGLLGSYFNSMDLSGTPYTRVDPTVDFTWNGASPAPGLGGTNFSVRWTGYVLPADTATYTVTTSSDDGIRVWVNSQEIINDWTDHAATYDSGTIALTAGQPVPITIEYYQDGGWANANLYWSDPCRLRAVVPQTQLYSNLSIAASPASTTIKAGAKQQFTATVLDANGVALSPQPTVAWSVSGGGTINSSGLFTSNTTGGGPFTVTAACGALSATASVTVLAPPAGVTAAAGYKQVTLSWSTSPAAQAYRVRRATVSGGPFSTVSTVTSTTWTNTGLTNGTTYYYVVVSTANGVDSAPSPQVSAIPKLFPPTGLSATPGNARVTLAWNAASGATSYRVRRGTATGGPYTTVATVASTTWTNAGLANGTTYYYVVASTDASGDSANSAPVSATPHLPPPPPAPTGLITKRGAGQVTLAWNASSGAASYNVKIATVSGGPYGTITGTTTLNYTSTGLANGTTYYFVVSAVNAGGESPNSAQVSAKPLAPPTGLTATPGSKKVSLSWNASAGASLYRVRRATASGGPYGTVASVAATAWTNTGLTAGTTYWYVVAASDGSGDSANSAPVSATAGP